MGNNLSTLKTYEAIRVQLEGGDESWSYVASNIFDILAGKLSNMELVCEPSLMEVEMACDLQLKDALCDVSKSPPGRLSEIVKGWSVVKKDTVDNLQLYEEEEWHDALCDVSSLGRLQEIVREWSVVKKDTVDNLQLEEEEEWHDALCDVSSLDRLQENLNEQFKTEREAGDNQRLGEEEEWHDTLCSVSDSLSDPLAETVNEQSMIERKPAEHLRIRNEEEMNVLSNVSDSLSDVRVDNVNKQLMLEGKAAVHLQVRDEEEVVALRHISNSPPGRLSEKEIVEEQPMMEKQMAGHLKLKDKDEESNDRSPDVSPIKSGHILLPNPSIERKAVAELQLKKYKASLDRSPTVLIVSPGKSGNILHLDANFSTSENKVSLNTPLTQDVASSTNELKKEKSNIEIVTDWSMMEKQTADTRKLKNKKEESHDRSAIVSNATPDKSDRIIPSDPNIERKATEEQQLKDKKEESHDRPPLVSNVSPDKSDRIIPSDSNTEGKAADHEQLTDKDERTHDRPPNVSPSKSGHILLSCPTMERKAAVELRLKNSHVGSHEMSSKVANVSFEKSDIMPSDPNVEGKAAEELQQKVNDGDFCDRSSNVLSVSPDTSENILPEGPNIENRAATQVQLTDKDEKSCDRSPNVPNRSPGKPGDILSPGPTLKTKAVEELRLKGKDEVSHDRSPKVPKVFPGKLGNILHSDPNCSTAESKQNTQFTQEAASSTNKLKKDSLQCLKEPPSLQNGFKLNPKAEVFIPRLKNVASTSTTVVKINDLEHKLKPAVHDNIPSGSRKMPIFKPEPGFSQRSSTGRRKKSVRPPSVTNKFKLNPKSHEFLPRQKNLQPLESESAENLKHTHATSDSNTTPSDRDLPQPKCATGDSTQETAEVESPPDQEATNSNDQLQPTAKSVVLPDVVTSNTISAFDQLTIDTSFDFMQDELFYYCALDVHCEKDVPTPGGASLEMINTHSTTASTIVGSDNQLSSNNLNPPNRKFCPTPGCRHHVDGRCNGASQMAQSGTGATVPDTQQEYLEYYAFPDSPVIHSATRRMNTDRDVTCPVTRDRRTERQAPKWNVNDSNFSIGLQKAEIWDRVYIMELYRTMGAEDGENVESKLQMAEVKKRVVISKIDLKMMEANHQVKLLYNMPCTMTKRHRDNMNESLDLYITNCTIMKHNVEILVQDVQEKLKQGENVDWSTINLQAPNFQCFQPSCHLMSHFDQTT